MVGGINVRGVKIALYTREKRFFASIPPILGREPMNKRSYCQVVGSSSRDMLFTGTPLWPVNRREHREQANFVFLVFRREHRVQRSDFSFLGVNTVYKALILVFWVCTVYISVIKQPPGKSTKYFLARI